MEGTSESSAAHARDHERGMKESHGGHAGHGHRTHKFDPANVERLLGEERRAALPPEEALRAAGVRPGQTVVDLGCGPGFFTIPAAAIVGDTGKVYGVDIEPQLVELCRRRAAEAGARQVEVVLAGESHVPLHDALADRVFIAFVLHEADDQSAFLGEARRLLKPGGEIAIVEWRKQDGSPGPPKEHRVSGEEIAALAGSGGLRVVEERNLNAHHYLLRLASAA